MENKAINSGKMEKFEDVLAWEKARNLTVAIYRITNKNSDFVRDFDLKSQIRKSSISIMSNIAEGFGRKSDKAFLSFLNIAHGSAAELQSHLYIALDLKYIEKSEFERLYDLAGEVSKIITGLGKYLKRNV